MSNRVVLWFVFLLAALVLLILLWPHRLEEPPHFERTPMPPPSPTPVPSFPTPMPPPAVPSTTAPTPAVSAAVATPMRPALDELDLLLADLAPAILAKDKSRVLEILDRMVSFGDRAVDRLTVLLHNPTDEDVREFAALGLARIGTPAALGELLNAIRSQQDPRLKRNLRHELRKLKNPAAMDLVFEGLLQDSVDWWQKDASSILSSMGTSAVVSRLLDVSQQAGQGYQDRIASTLERIKNPAAIPGLANAVKPGVNPLVQEGASNALVTIGTVEATTSLLQVVREVAETDHRERLLAAFERLANKDSTHILEQALDDETSANVRAAAANALGNFENEPILSHLEQAYERETDRRAKDAMAQAIQRLGARAM